MASIFEQRKSVNIGIKPAEGRDIGEVMPQQKTSGAAGADVRSLNAGTIQPWGRVFLPLGFHVEIPEGYEIQVRSRSSLAKRGVCVSNQPGTVDSDYKGEMRLMLMNLSDVPFRFEKGERLAQIVVSEKPLVTFSEIQELSESSRGEGGFGSTGRF